MAQKIPGGTSHTGKSPRQHDTTDRRPEGLPSGVEGFDRRAGRAVRDRTLHGAIERYARTSVATRNRALGALAEAPRLRERAYGIKKDVMANLDRYLEEMADRVEARGGNVFIARDGEDVARYIGEIARRRGSRVITKSKSMATEEIELNRRLEEADPELEVVETDLGEWIAQLAGDTPSHIVAPIVHMTRYGVAELLSEVSGREMPPNVEDMTRFARERLREKFLTADIGITGANFGVAETGTIVTVTNEGNGRLVASVPPVHVVVMGIEKIVPRFSDLSVFLRLLARSSTGQKLSVYTNFVTGPRGEGEMDGAEEMHLVLLDNGRSDILGTPFEEALYCIRCGACLNVCPVYRQTGGHAYGSTYSGPIGAVISPLLNGGDDARDLPHASSLCGACSEACPVGIPLHELLLKLRARQVDEGTASKAQAIMFGGFERTMNNPKLYEMGTKAARVVQRPLVKNGSVKPLPGPLAAWTDTRELPPLADKTFREIWREGLRDG
jgi:L-lactate dehydrogenase complex protein LldF